MAHSRLEAWCSQKMHRSWELGSRLPPNGRVSSGDTVAVWCGSPTQWCARSALATRQAQGRARSERRQRGRWYRRNDVEVTILDTEANAETAVEQYGTLVDRGVIGFVGGLVVTRRSPSHRRRPATIMEVSPASTAPQLSTAGRPTGGNSSPERSRATGHRRR